MASSKSYGLLFQASFLYSVPYFVHLLQIVFFSLKLYLYFLTATEKSGEKWPKIDLIDCMLVRLPHFLCFTVYSYSIISFSMRAEKYVARLHGFGL